MHATGPRSRIAAPAILLALSLACVQGLDEYAVRAAAPNVREVTPAGISIDGSRSDWDSPGRRLPREHVRGGHATKPVLSKLYSRYDCATETMYVEVVTTTGGRSCPRMSTTTSRSDRPTSASMGTTARGPCHRRSRTSATTAWEASFQLDPGTYTGDANGLNVHAEVVPDTRASTSAVSGRRLDIVIDCSAPRRRHRHQRSHHGTPAPPPPRRQRPRRPAPLHRPQRAAPGTDFGTPAPTGTPAPPAPRRQRHPALTSTPTGTPAPTAHVAPTGTVGTDRDRDGTPTRSDTDPPTGTVAPAGDPPLIAVKVNDQGTSTIEDDRITAVRTSSCVQMMATVAMRPNGDDAPVIDTADAPRGFAVFDPPGPGDYWVTETNPPGWSGCRAAAVGHIHDEMARTAASSGIQRSACADDDADRRVHHRRGDGLADRWFAACWCDDARPPTPRQLPATHRQLHWSGSASRGSRRADASAVVFLARRAASAGSVEPEGRSDAPAPPGVGSARAVSSVGQSASLTPRKSLVRVQYRPPDPGKRPDGAKRRSRDPPDDVTGGVPPTPGAPRPPGTPFRSSRVTLSSRLEPDAFESRTAHLAPTVKGWRRPPGTVLVLAAGHRCYGVRSGALEDWFRCATPTGSWASATTRIGTPSKPPTAVSPAGITPTSVVTRS